MIYGANLKKILEEEMQAGRGTRGYRERLRPMLGITENVDTGDLLYDPSQQVIRARDIDFAELARTFFGRKPDGPMLRHAFDPSTRERIALQEAEGSVVLPSHFANISAFTDTVAGLIDVLTLEGYQQPEYIGDEFFTTHEARVQGGKKIGVRTDGAVSEDLAPNEPYPTVGALETYVHIPDNQRFGNVIQINEGVFIYDRTDQIQNLAPMAGRAVRRAKELRQADCVLGRTNTYMRDGVTSNTYRLLADTTAPTDNAGARSPNNFINAKVASPLNDWQAWNVAKQLLSRNIDPATGWEIAVNPAESVIWCSPDNELFVRTVVNATGIQTRTTMPVATQATAVQLNIRDSANPMGEYKIRIVSSRIWYNRLAVAGTNQPGRPTAFSASNEIDATVTPADTAAKAQSTWLWGAPKRAFEYRQVIPFQTMQLQLSSEDQRRDIVAIYQSREWGVPFVVEPRYMAFMHGDSSWQA